MIDQSIATLTPPEEKMTTMPMSAPVIVSAAVELTPRQRDIVEFVNAFTAEHGYCPSYREIGEGVGLRSPASVHSQVEKLKSRGVLDRVPNRSRTTLVAGVAA
jgi:hypothetical protein